MGSLRPSEIKNEEVRTPLGTQAGPGTTRPFSMENEILRSRPRSRQRSKNAGTEPTVVEVVTQPRRVVTFFVLLLVTRSSTGYRGRRHRHRVGRKKPDARGT